MVLSKEKTNISIFIYLEKTDNLQGFKFLFYSHTSSLQYIFYKIWKRKRCYLPLVNLQSSEKNTVL